MPLSYVHFDTHIDVHKNRQTPPRKLPLWGGNLVFTAGIFVKKFWTWHKGLSCPGQLNFDLDKCLLGAPDDDSDSDITFISRWDSAFRHWYVSGWCTVVSLLLIIILIMCNLHHYYCSQFWQILHSFMLQPTPYHLVSYFAEVYSAQTLCRHGWQQ